MAGKKVVGRYNDKREDEIGHVDEDELGVGVDEKNLGSKGLHVEVLFLRCLQIL